MHKLLENKHFINTTAKVIMYCITLIVVGLLFWRAPEQAIQVMNASVYVLGGVTVGSKLGIKK